MIRGIDENVLVDRQRIPRGFFLQVKMNFNLRKSDEPNGLPGLSFSDRFVR